MALKDIEHTKTNIKPPKTNDTFHKTILNKCYQVTLHKKINELQIDLDEWLSTVMLNELTKATCAAGERGRKHSSTVNQLGRTTRCYPLGVKFLN